MALAIACVGAAGTVVSAYLVARVQKVQRTVNGHTDRLERKIADLERRIASRDQA